MELNFYYNHALQDLFSTVLAIIIKQLQPDSSNCNGIQLLIKFNNTDDLIHIVLQQCAQETWIITDFLSCCFFPVVKELCIRKTIKLGCYNIIHCTLLSWRSSKSHCSTVHSKHKLQSHSCSIFCYEPLAVSIECFGNNCMYAIHQPSGQITKHFNSKIIFIVLQSNLRL